MELQYPWMLLTLLTVPLLYWLLRRRRPPAVVISTVMPVKPIACRRRKLSCLEYSVRWHLPVPAEPNRAK